VRKDGTKSASLASPLRSSIEERLAPLRPFMRGDPIGQLRQAWRGPPLIKACPFSPRA